MERTKFITLIDMIYDTNLEYSLIYNPLEIKKQFIVLIGYQQPKCDNKEATIIILKIPNSEQIHTCY